MQLSESHVTNHYVVQNIAENFQPCVQGTTTLQTDDRQTDRRPMPLGERNVVINVDGGFGG